MLRLRKEWFRVALVLVLVAVLPADLAAEATHVVSAPDLQESVLSVTKTRQENIFEIRRFLSSDGARRVMESEQLDIVQVKNAVASLSDAELARLAAQTDGVNSNFAAGRWSTTEIVVVVVIAAILIAVFANSSKFD